VTREELTRLRDQLQSVLAVSNAFRGEQLEHAMVFTSLDHRAIGRAFEAYRCGRRDVDPMLATLVADDLRIVTRRRGDAVSDRVWYRSRFVREYLAPLGMDHLLQSEVRLPGGVVHRLALARAWGNRPFTSADRDRVYRFHRDLLARWRDDEDVQLTPRMKAVLASLVRGESAKEVAEELGLHHASIDREIQSLYQHFGVGSRAELLAAAAEGHVDPEAGRLVDRLSPRERQALSLLLTGISEHDIAWAMGISFHTLHEYVKRTYRTLRVRSRPELMARYAGLRAR
jgi:DNA-binding NarL/FixJ family response regulator